MKTATSLLLVIAVVQVLSVKGLYEFEWAADETFHDSIQEFPGRKRRAPIPTASPDQDNKTVDHHTYYTSQFYEHGEKYWIELRGNNKSVQHAVLSSQSLLAVKQSLSFKFPYYGHLLSSLYITTGGFLYLGEPSRLMTQVQFIAPLMAYFNPKLNETASVHYYDDGQKFIVQWDNVHLHNNTDVGPFTFQVILHKSGKIVFAYKSLPKSAAKIPESDQHPVKIGVSDAFYILVLIRGFYYRHYFIYDEVLFNKSKIFSGVAVVLSPKPNCVAAASCADCIHTSQTTDFTCGWCPKLQRCSDGLDRKRVEWYRAGCPQTKLNSCDVAQTTKLPTTKMTEIETQPPCRLNSCDVAQTTKLPTTKVTEIETQPPCRSDSCKNPVARSGEDSSTGPSVGVIVAICIVFVAVIALATWVFYAFRHPTTSSGLCLIRVTRQPRNIFKRRADASPAAAYQTQA